MQRLFSKAFSPVVALLALVVAAHAGELKITDLKKGTGAEAVAGKKVTVHYTGWLLNGKKFDSSLDRGRPFSFIPGQGRVIQGWEKGVLGMKVGGKRELIIPPELGYGARGAGAAIPPNSTLKFEISLLKVSEPPVKDVSNAELKELLAKGIKIIDIRRPDEWKKTGVVKGSLLMTFFDKRGRQNPTFLKRFAKMFKKDDKVILICRTGNRSGVLSQGLAEQLGYKGIINVKHGITRWMKEGNPVEKAEMPKDCWLCAK